MVIDIETYCHTHVKRTFPTTSDHLEFGMLTWPLLVLNEPSFFEKRRPSSLTSSHHITRTNCVSDDVNTQRAHDVYTTSAQRRCNVMTLHRRWGDVVLTSCARWVCLRYKQHNQHSFVENELIPLFALTLSFIMSQNKVERHYGTEDIICKSKIKYKRKIHFNF